MHSASLFVIEIAGEDIGLVLATYCIIISVVFIRGSGLQESDILADLVFRHGFFVW